jgi:tetratricopeptide (TPR) repeat protein
MSGFRAGIAIVLGLALTTAPGVALAQGTSGEVESVPNYGTYGGGGAPRYNATNEYMRGMADFQSGNYKDAATHFQHSADVGPRAASTWLMLGMSKAGEGDQAGAEKAYEKAVKIDGAMVAAHRELALTLIKLQKPDRAGVELAWLKTRAAACGATCPDASELRTSIDDVTAAMGPVAGG